MFYLQKTFCNKSCQKVIKKLNRILILVYISLSILLFTACSQTLSGTWVGTDFENNRTETIIFRGNTVELKSVLQTINGHDEFSGTFILEDKHIIFTFSEVVAYRNGQIDNDVISEAQAMFIGNPLTFTFTRSGNVITINDINYTLQR